MRSSSDRLRLSLRRVSELWSRADRDTTTPPWTGDEKRLARCRFRLVKGRKDGGEGRSWRWSRVGVCERVWLAVRAGRSCCCRVGLCLE
jgi:hypothetical protein